MASTQTKHITDFIKQNRILSLCCVDTDSKPYCFHCFYAFDEANHLLFFKSSTDTFHAGILAQNPSVAGSILPENINLIALKGIQLTGTVLYTDIPDHINPESFYHKKFPFALAKPGKVWCIGIDAIKMTDNTNVFGKKLAWQREELV
ncbi:pyridoxamine 5'-phosphate oxidase family protein [uncultured Mucilaginibacter sp.]|uniref:pyridoxamine 5'-phosphate oxidase family protein n=1 Tax=uncultured Mucilaginibacter sp. TaxID=797541 RepID=UPI0025DDF376|nr:pyridoxamine 5'-phosphate oxidase family protein [uncultured Mucilaginibacter sp.]